MRKIIRQTTARVFERGQWWDKTDTDSVEVPDPTPTPVPAPVRTLTTHAQACARCGQTGCRCTTTPPRAQAQDDEEGWMPKSILYPQGQDTQPAPMSAEMRALRTAQADWWTLYTQCQSYPNCLVPDRQMKESSIPQLTALSRELQSGKIVKEWRDEAMEAWKPRGLLDQYPRKP